jgi:hypothetical protein
MDRQRQVVESPQIEQSVNGVQPAKYTEYCTAEDEQGGDHR